MTTESFKRAKESSEYWDKFYGKKAAPANPSNFAEWVYDNFLSEGSRLFEIGCGNGRDARWFASRGLNVWALDQSLEATAVLASELNPADKLVVMHQSISDLINSDAFPIDVDFIYSRFFLHSIAKSECDDLLQFIGKRCRLGTVCMHEFRVLEDMINFKGHALSNDELITDHYRRFIDFTEVLNFINKNGWEVLSAIKGQGLAIHGSEDPVVGRVIFKII